MTVFEQFETPPPSYNGIVTFSAKPLSPQYTVNSAR